jgi:multicomponent K+:H+ antiporter subunit E
VKPLRHILPHPLLSLALLIFWLWLQGSLQPADIVLGLLLGLLIPLLTSRFWPMTGRIKRPIKAVGFMMLVLGDIVLANLQVARQILGRVGRLEPGFVRVPLDLRTDVGIAVLANTITLTPGTLTAEVAADRRSLLVHALHLPDPQATVRAIKDRYERRIREIFEC